MGFLWLSQSELISQAKPLLERVLEQPVDDELADRVRTTLQLPQTLRRRPETPEAKVHNEARVLAKKSLDAGFLKDAVRYLEVAHETDPIDFGVMLQLGWANNILKDDRMAVKWFGFARNSPDPKQAAEADRAYRNMLLNCAAFTRPPGCTRSSPHAGRMPLVMVKSKRNSTSANCHCALT